MTPHSKPIEKAKLRVIAEWLDRASQWLEEEVRDNRERDQIEGISDPRQAVETLTFLRPELDRMVLGFRRATEILVTMTDPLAISELPPMPTNDVACLRPHLRIVK